MNGHRSPRPGQGLRALPQLEMAGPSRDCLESVVLAAAMSMAEQDADTARRQE